MTTQNLNHGGAMIDAAVPYRRPIWASLHVLALTCLFAPLVATTAHAEVTGTIKMNGSEVVSVSQISSGDVTTGAGWSWDGAGTLTLGAGYASGPIEFITTGNVSLALTDNVTVTDATLGFAIKSAGNLAIDAGNSTLDVEMTVDNYMYRTINVTGSLTINSGTVNAKYSGGAAASAIFAGGGDITIQGSAAVTAEATGALGFGIRCADGAIIITGSSQVTAKGNGSAGIGLYSQGSNSGITVSGSAEATATSPDNFAIVVTGGDFTVSDNANLNPANADFSSIYVASGGEVIFGTGGTVNAKDPVDAIKAANGGNITISAGMVNAVSTGTGSGLKIDGSGTINITGGTVTATTAGTLNHTGGTLNGNPPPTVAHTVNINSTIANACGNSADNGATSENISPAAGNTLNINSGGNVTVFAHGAYVNSSGALSATGNTVNVNSGGTVQSGINGAYVVSSDDGATASGNSVNIAAGVTVGGSVFGGQAQANNISGSGAAVASSNTVTIDGTVNASGWTISGGSANSVYGGSGSSATASNNIVTINAGAAVTVNYITGGYAATGSGSPIDATCNIVTIKNASLNPSVNLYGGDSGSGAGDVFTGNTLNLEQSSLTVRGLANFAIYNFTLPQATAANSTVITATNGNGASGAIDINSVTADITFTAAPTFSAGDKITLIDGGTYGVTGTPTTTSVAASGYDFTIAVEGGKLVATVTAVSGIAKVKENELLRIHPNPAHSVLNVELKHPSNGTLSLFDIRGNTVLNHAVNGSTSATINLSGLPSGTYILHLIENGVAAEVKIVKE
ncbi:MAG: T9SS type A sorting domain-containing protein [Dysgonamonadaceae bacterium]|nr:T9SS type A sorting domain-containing protein [Dysgonamonadaceae bacterium]